MSEEQELERICGTCEHYDSDNSCCPLRGEDEMYDEDTCDDWEKEA